MKKTIRVTKNYEQFGYKFGNRKVEMNPNYIKKLVKAMSENYIPIPIMVNPNFEVLDGQHRLEAIKQLNLPVYFIITDDLDVNDIRGINSVVKKWSMDEYLQSFKDSEGEIAGPYTTLDWYRKKYNLNLDTSIAILHNSGTMLSGVHRDEFKNGKFEVKNLSWAKSFGNFLLKIKPYFAHFNKRAFVFALLHLDQDHRFDRKTFIHRMEVNSMKMRRCTNVEDYFELLEYIYNIGSRPKFRFDRKEEWVQTYKPLR